MLTPSSSRFTNKVTRYVGTVTSNYHDGLSADGPLLDRRRDNKATDRPNAVKSVWRGHFYSDISDSGRRDSLHADDPKPAHRTDPPST